jgi:hypothetical protein
MLTAQQRKKLITSAIMTDFPNIVYSCPNNRKNGNKTGHFYRMWTSEILSKTKHPKCPYCKKKTEMINYDKKELDNVDEQKDLSGTDT